MKKFQGITIISDMDGTLLNDDKKISEKNLSALSYFVENGGKFTIASGRVLSRLQLYSDQLPVNLPIITMNGMMIQDLFSGEVFHKERLDPSAREYTRQIIEKYPHFGLEIFTEDTVYFIHRNRHIDKHISDEGFSLKMTTLPQVTDEWVKVLFGCDENVLNIIEEEFPYMKEKVHFTKSDAYFYEILAKNCHKGSALKKLLELTEIRKEMVLAVGDNKNDLEFVGQAGIGVAVANACDEVKRNSKIVLAQNNNQAPLRELVEKLENGEIVW